MDNGRLASNTGKNTANGLALARDSRAVICVDDQQPPYSFVQVQGNDCHAEQQVLLAGARDGPAIGQCGPAMPAPEIRTVAGAIAKRMN